jgi:hypothetical protein
LVGQFKGAQFALARLSWPDRQRLLLALAGENIKAVGVTSGHET